MSETSADVVVPSTEELDKHPTPPRSTPSPTGLNTSETKLSRKREREISVEPATPTAHDTEPFILERKHSGLPLKKNRRVLDPTEEEEDNGLHAGPDSGSRSESASPPESQFEDSVLTSPRREMKRKVRQISRGVEDICWKGPSEPSISEQDLEIPEDIIPSTITAAPVADVIDSTYSLVVTNGNATTPPKVIEHIIDEVTPPKTPDEPMPIPDFNTVEPETETQLPPNEIKKETDEKVGGLRTSSEGNEKKLKRKYLERGTSQGPAEENGQTPKHPSEPLKRPRDDSDKDDNPRETKRPTPPPSPTASTKASGFMAYASTASPFASVKGQNIFSSKPTPSPFASSSTLSQRPSGLAPPFGSSTTSSQRPSGLAPPFGSSVSFSKTPAKRSGFESFATKSSPFASFTNAKSPGLGMSNIVHSASPSRGSTFSSSPFASYTGSNNNVFGLAVQKHRLAGSPDVSPPRSPERKASPTKSVFGQVEYSGDEDEGDLEERPQSFSEKLRASKDNEYEEEKRVQLTAQNVLTGEETDETIIQVRGKLFFLQNNSWKERGTGVLKLNVRQDDGTGARLVMRKDAVYTLLLNVTLFVGMHCTLAQDPRYLRFTAIENGAVVTYNLKVADARVAQDLLEEINANIPSQPQ